MFLVSTTETSWSESCSGSRLRASSPTFCRTLDSLQFPLLRRFVVVDSFGKDLSRQPGRQRLHVQHPCVVTVHFLLSRCEGRFSTAVNHEYEGIGDTDEGLPVMGELVSEKSWDQLPRTPVGSWKTTGLKNEPPLFTTDTTDDDQITWKHVMFHSWKRLNTTWLVTCDSVANRETLRNSRYSVNQSQKTVLGKRTVWIPILILTEISSSLVVDDEIVSIHLRKGVRILSFYDSL